MQSLGGIRLGGLTMQRHQLHSLKAWLHSSNRKPLVIRGARQVGKSTLVELLVRERDIDAELFAVNLERHPQLAQAFSDRNPRELLRLMQALPGVGRLGEHSIVFLDEIQAVPAAFAALRYFLEDMPERPVIAAGSLMEFMLSDHTFSMPVGRIEYLHMGPMTFSEFLAGVGESVLADEICQYEFDVSRADDQWPHPLVHERLLNLLKLYFFIGGMPEAVKVYAETGDLTAVSGVHASIIDTYRDDFTKYAARRDLTRMLDVFNFAARHAGRKVKYSNISPGQQSGTLRRDVDILAMARVIAKVTHSHCSGLPLQADLKAGAFKLLFLDVGLMNAICGLNWNTLAAETETRLINSGANAEQFIGQHLAHVLSRRPNRELTYWLREGRANNAEVDFAAEFAGRIVPIEVKAGRTGTLRSLHQFAAEKRPALAVRFDLGEPSLQTVEASAVRGTSATPVRYPILSLPLYLVERLPRIIEGLVQ